MGRRSARRSWRARRLFRVLAAAVSALLFVTMGWLWFNYNRLDNGLHRVAVDGLRSDPTGGSKTVAQNILLIGSDSRQGLSAKERRTLGVGSDSVTDSTDTILLVHIPADGTKATLVSIPRDSYVAIAGHPDGKINAAFADGYEYTDGAVTTDQRFGAAMNVLLATITNLTGVPIDHYVVVNFRGFYDIAKAIGGIDVDLCHSVNDTNSVNVAEGLGNVGSGFRMSAGEHHLTPVQTLQFVRQRHNLPGVGDDLGREARQRYFLAAAFHRIESGGTLLDPSRLSNIVDAVKSTLTIDPGLSLQNLAEQMASLTGSHIVGQTIPTDGYKLYPPPAGDSVVVDPAQVRTTMARLFSDAVPSARSAAASGASETRTSSAAPTDPSGCIN